MQAKSRKNDLEKIGEAFLLFKIDLWYICQVFTVSKYKYQIKKYPSLWHDKKRALKSDADDDCSKRRLLMMLTTRHFSWLSRVTTCQVSSVLVLTPWQRPAPRNQDWNLLTLTKLGSAESQWCAPSPPFWLLVYNHHPDPMMIRICVQLWLNSNTQCCPK